MSNGVKQNMKSPGLLRQETHVWNKWRWQVSGQPTNQSSPGRMAIIPVCGYVCNHSLARQCESVIRTTAKAYGKA